MSLCTDNSNKTRRKNTIQAKLNDEKYKKPIEVLAEEINIKNNDEIDEVNLKLINCIQRVVYKSKESIEKIGPSKFNEEESSKTLHKKRAELLKTKNETIHNRVELNLVSKVIKRKIREKEEKVTNEIIKTTLEGNKNIKKIN